MSLFLLSAAYDGAIDPRSHSLGGNELKVEGAQVMAALLKTNATITSLE